MFKPNESINNVFEIINTPNVNFYNTQIDNEYDNKYSDLLNDIDEQIYIEDDIKYSELLSILNNKSFIDNNNKEKLFPDHYYGSTYDINEEKIYEILKNDNGKLDKIIVGDSSLSDILILNYLNNENCILSENLLIKLLNYFKNFNPPSKKWYIINNKKIIKLFKNDTYLKLFSENKNSFMKLLIIMYNDFDYPDIVIKITNILKEKFQLNDKIFKWLYKIYISDRYYFEIEDFNYIHKFPEFIKFFELDSDNYPELFYFFEQDEDSKLVSYKELNDDSMDILTSEFNIGNYEIDTQTDFNFKNIFTITDLNEKEKQFSIKLFNDILEINNDKLYSIEVYYNMTILNIMFLKNITDNYIFNDKQKQIKLFKILLEKNSLIKNILNLDYIHYKFDNKCVKYYINLFEDDDYLSLFIENKKLLFELLTIQIVISFPFYELYRINNFLINKLNLGKNALLWLYTHGSEDVIDNPKYDYLLEYFDIKK